MTVINISIKCILVYYSSLFLSIHLYMENAFKTIHRKNKWGGGSGTGSKMSRNNKKYISILIKYYLMIKEVLWKLLKKNLNLQNV